MRELDITLDRNSPVPLYHQLAQAIEHAISSGVLAPGDRLENELSMTSRLGLSRPTAREAEQPERGPGQGGQAARDPAAGVQRGPAGRGRARRHRRRRGDRERVHQDPPAPAGRRRAAGHPHQLPAGPPADRRGRAAAPRSLRLPPRSGHQPQDRPPADLRPADASSSPSTASPTTTSASSSSSGGTSTTPRTTRSSPRWWSEPALLRELGQASRTVLRRTTGSSLDQGKLIHWSVSRQA